MSRAALFTCCALVATMTLLARPAAAQSKTVEGPTVTVTGTVEAIDSARRVLSVKDSKGEYHEIEVPESNKSFSTVKIGDRLTLRYYENMVLRLKKPGEPDVDTATGGRTPGTGAQTAGTVAAQRTITATITAIDPKVPSITFTGPNDWKYSSRVQDRKALAQVKVGDKVDITWTTAMLASLEPAK